MKSHYKDQILKKYKNIFAKYKEVKKSMKDFKRTMFGYNYCTRDLKKVLAAYRWGYSFKNGPSVLWNHTDASVKLAIAMGENPSDLGLKDYKVHIRFEDVKSVDLEDDTVKINYESEGEKKVYSIRI